MGTLHESNKILNPLFGQISQSHPQTPKPSTHLSRSSDEGQEGDDEQVERNSDDESRNLISRRTGSFDGDQHPLKDTAEYTVEAEDMEIDPNASRRKRRKSTPQSTNPVSHSVTEQPSKETKQKSGPLNAFDKLLSKSQPPSASYTLTSDSAQITKSDQTTIIPKVSRRAKRKVAPDEQVEKSNDSREETHLTLDNIPTSKPAIESSRQIDNKPQKLLKLNTSTGTIGSPPSKQPSLDIIDHSSRPKRGRKPKKQVIIIKYGSDEETRSTIGLEINSILVAKSDKPSVLEPQLQKSEATLLLKSKGPPKATHPFFLGKHAPVATPEIQSAQDSDTKDRAGVMHTRSKSSTRISMVQPHHPTEKSGAVSTFTGFSGYGNANAKLTKFPGAVEPAWPGLGMVHIRGEQPILSGKIMSVITKSTKKLKNAAVSIAENEDVISRLAAKLDVTSIADDLKATNSDDFEEPPSSLRLPTKHFQPGHWLQCKLRKELVAKVRPKPDDMSHSEDELPAVSSRHKRVHPAIINSYSALATSLTAFDRYQYEPMLWTQKYAPKSSEMVLQEGKEVIILRDWLQALTVMSVETGTDSHTRNTSGNTKKGTLKKKKKRKGNKLEGFVISSEEEESDLDALLDDEELALMDGSAAKKTVVRGGMLHGSKNTKRPDNAIVISGPHGSGKTASVYAVAKELGFEVFEINAGSRRNGKDIMEKVGDMTRNHQVQRTKDSGISTPLDEDMQRVSEALDKDLKSGRQGTMNAFFQPKGESKPGPKPKSKPTYTLKPTSSTQSTLASKSSPRTQKQALILLEEVDVLYEDDKLFWGTIIALIAQSKRPVIMTCNDESVVPLQTLSLHAVLRFSAAPVDVAVDYMLCVAANEGHLLRRKAVKCIYDTKQHDLRATLTELNFWCQMGLGDRRGGLEWFLPRYPQGIDEDEHGHTIRVISEGTYKTGLGWLNRDSISVDNRPLDIEEESLHQAWENWGLDIGDWHETLRTKDWAQNLKAVTTDKKTNLEMLTIYDGFTESMSIADICTGHELSSSHDVLLDPSLPDIPGKVRDDYLISQPLLQVDPLIRYSNLGTDIGLWMRSRSREHVQVDMIAKKWEALPELDALLESHVIERIKRRNISPRKEVNRADFSVAFDPIAEFETTISTTSNMLEASVFDRTFSMLAVDVAPFVRSIVTSDSKLKEERLRLSNLLSEGSKKSKRVRTTRAAMSALEGGHRKNTRRDKYFGNSLNAILVQRTGGGGWQEAASTALNVAEGYMSTDSSREATPKTRDVTDEIPESSQ